MHTGVPVVRRLVLFLLALGLVAGPATALAAPASSSAPTYFGMRVVPAFSPDGDGRREEATVRYAVPEPGDATVLVQSTDTGRLVIRRTVELTDLAAGQHTWRWDGRDGQGAMLPDGTYRLELLFTMADGTRRVTNASTRIDTEVSVHLTRGETYGVARDAVQTVYPRTEVVRDSLGMVPEVGEPVHEATLLIKDRAGRTVLQRDVTKWHRAKRFEEIRWTARRGGQPLPAGRYRAVIRAKDRVGNEGRSAAIDVRVSRRVLTWRTVTKVVTPAATDEGGSWCTSAPGSSCHPESAGPCGTVVPSAFYPGGLSYRSGQCTGASSGQGAENIHVLPVPRTTGVRGVHAARVAFSGRPTVAGEGDAGRLVVLQETEAPTAVATGSTGARTEWARDLWGGEGHYGEGMFERIEPPSVKWTFGTSGTDSVDVEEFTVTMRYLAVKR